MLRYIKHNLTGIDGVDIYPMISLLLFVIFFLVMFLYVARMKKSRIEELSALPLEEDVEPEQEIVKTN
ncbi:MAG: CcoQ/FixQ family Cbb3-type cytochrome c oxidase assembly chaperone [Arcobacter sp.]|nr:MAG: CcoQ/FixQ family Cbb3-type cytochrome c oxidase assembly chaperone [Fluviicola sp.]PHR53586.1 MAG: CcoQ/FixQ family Cbb3-type cytochrome c oxidase assembly chaperone [Arcobacter sp.]